MNPTLEAAARFRRLLGPIDTVPTASHRVTRAFTIDGVRYERWILNGAHGEIPAYALFPESASTPAPALLALHSHDRQFDIGKSGVVGLVGDPEVALGVIAARLGFAVLAPDLPGFEDNRPRLSDRKANYSLQGEAYERLLAMNALLAGRTLQARISSDLFACVSALSGDSRVDPRRVFAAGHSFGGQESVWATLLDERVAGCLSSCGFSLVRLIVERQISHNMALYVPGLLPALDFDEVAAAISGRPFYVIAAEADAIYPVEGVRLVHERLMSRRGDQRAEFRYIPGPHAFSPEAVVHGLRWLLAALPLPASTAPGA